MSYFFRKGRKESSSLTNGINERLAYFVKAKMALGVVK